MDIDTAECSLVGPPPIGHPLGEVGTTLVSRTPGGGARALVARGLGLVSLRKGPQLAVEPEREHQSERAGETPG